MRKLLTLILVFAVMWGGTPAARGAENCNPAGWEERGPQWVKWLASSVRINGASGTMCYYESQTGYMYVISAGHLFGSLGYRLGKNTAPVEVFYFGSQKLPRPRRYTAEILASVYDHDTSNHYAYDVSLLRFRPDWDNPQYSPIAPKDYKLESGKYYHSVGCDERTEPAHYLVPFWGEESIGGGLTQVLTQNDYPRGGRSGGGVFTEDGYLVFICSRRRGDGPYGGLWTSLSQIYKFLESSGYLYITIEIPAKKRRIVDLDTGRLVPKEFILVPFGSRR